MQQSDVMLAVFYSNPKCGAKLMMIPDRGSIYILDASNYPKKISNLAPALSMLYSVLHVVS